MTVLVFTNLFPNKQKPHHGLFIKKRISFYKKIGFDPVVMVPIAWFPFYKRYNFHFWGFKRETDFEGIKVIYFKYIHIPKIGMLFQPFSILLSTLVVFLFFKERKKIKFIDCHYLYPDGVAVYLLTKFYKLPYLLSARGSDVNVILRSPIPRKMILKSFSDSFKIIAVSQNLKDIILEYYSENKKISVIPNGVDPESFYLIPHIGQNRKKNNFKRLLMVGNLIEQKGQHLLIEALERARDFNYSLVAYFIGTGELAPLIRSNFRIGNKIRLKLIGPVPNHFLVNYYNKMDLLCLLSESEGNPNVILEALACGLPVLATDVGDLRGLINGNNGHIIEKREINNIIDGLKFCLNKQWDREKISKCVEPFRWEETTEKIKTIFTDLIHDYNIKE